jgi:hypothetical protein
MEDYLPPCHERDDWFTLDNRGSTGAKTPAELEADCSNAIRTKLTCMTRCKMRKQCMKAALDFEGEEYHRWFVWGGYSPGERRRISRTGPIPAPGHSSAARFDRINEFIDYHLTRSEAAERWGITERAVETVLNRYLWDLRVAQEDVWVVLRDNETEKFPSTDMAQQPDSVRAA